MISSAMRQDRLLAKASNTVLQFLLLPCDYQRVGPALLFCDNTAAVQLADGETSSKRLRHVATRLALLREFRATKDIELHHLYTEGQIADILTKPLSAQRFHSLRDLLLR